jgi:toxin YoeB
MAKQVILTPNCIEEIIFWTQTSSRMALKIWILVQDIQKDNFKGTGKPEPLKHEFKGYWSRRINKEHRLVYKVEKDKIIIYSCRYHY